MSNFRDFRTWFHFISLGVFVYWANELVALAHDSALRYLDSLPTPLVSFHHWPSPPSFLLFSPSFQTVFEVRYGRPSYFLNVSVVEFQCVSLKLVTISLPDQSKGRGFHSNDIPANPPGHGSASEVARGSGLGPHGSPHHDGTRFGIEGGARRVRVRSTSLVVVVLNFSQSIQQMKEATAVVENTSDYVREEIARKKAIHNKDVADLIRHEHSAYYQKALDSSLAYDDLALHDERGLEKVRDPSTLLPLHLIILWLQLAASTLRGTSISRVQALQQSYLRAVVPLREKLAKIRAIEAEQRRRSQANFPMTVTDFLAIRDKSHQLHICQFLMLEDTIRDKDELRSKRDTTMTTYRWVWRQVTPLCEEYAKNVSICSLRANSAHDA